MLLVDLISGTLVTTGASLMLIGVIGLMLTRAEERKQKEEKENEYDADH